jgi:hypothetical protein
MAEPLNVISPSTFTTCVVIGDPEANSGGSADSTPQISEVLNPAATTILPVSAALDVQSTKGAVFMPRMTTTQRNALDNAVTTIGNGGFIYNTTSNQFEFYMNGAWKTFTPVSA